MNLQTSIFVLALFASATGNAWHNNGSGYHGGGYYRGGEGYYGGGWGAPNIVIAVPPRDYYAPDYYVPVCETVRICNQYNRCWLEQECN